MNLNHINLDDDLTAMSELTFHVGHNNVFQLMPRWPHVASQMRIGRVDGVAPSWKAVRAVIKVDSPSPRDTVAHTRVVLEVEPLDYCCCPEVIWHGHVKLRYRILCVGKRWSQKQAARTVACGLLIQSHMSIMAATLAANQGMKLWLQLWLQLKA
jgi:hypothetical protein